ncbi:MAG: DUF1565 domain-containing protein [Candidatus Bathyarchaeia archaeon]|jgi:parallel beta-helix repeat protein
MASLSWQSSGNILSGNNVTANSDCGIYLYSSSDNALTGNNAANNYIGILLESSSGNTLSGNNVQTMVLASGSTLILVTRARYTSIGTNSSTNKKTTDTIGRQLPPTKKQVN